MQGFTLNAQTALLPQIWIMAIVVAALDAWASSGPADLAPPADIIGRYTHLTNPRRSLPIGGG